MSIISCYLFRIAHKVSSLSKGIRRKWNQFICEGQLAASRVEFKNVKFYGRPIMRFSPQAKVCFGEGVVIRSGSEQSGVIGNRAYSVIKVERGGALLVDNQTGMSNVAIHCCQSVTIGKHVNIGAGTMIFDTDFHSLRWQDRENGTDIENRATGPVVIDDLAFIGADCIILKGVHIGEKSIIGAGSVVSRDVPSGEIWAGNPARFIKKIE